jgi:hypothetical protein
MSHPQICPSEHLVIMLLVSDRPHSAIDFPTDDHIMIDVILYKLDL